MSNFVAYRNEHHSITQQGFQMTFANGYTVSVAFGSVNYCDKGETTAEVWAWDKDGNPPSVLWYGKRVGARLSPSAVLAYMNAVQSL